MAKTPESENSIYKIVREFKIVENASDKKTSSNRKNLHKHLSGKYYLQEIKQRLTFVFPPLTITKVLQIRVYRVYKIPSPERF